MTPEPQRPDESELRPRPRRTLCPHCMGMGAVNQPRLALSAETDSETGYTVGVPGACQQCSSGRWLSGLQPPM